jgi:hypothetical protein
MHDDPLVKQQPVFSPREVHIMSKCSTQASSAAAAAHSAASRVHGCRWQLTATSSEEDEELPQSRLWHPSRPLAMMEHLQRLRLLAHRSVQSVSLTASATTSPTQPAEAEAELAARSGGYA